MTKIKLNLDSLKTRRDWKRHKVKDGHNIFRVLPPFGEASNGYPYRRWNIIWGLMDPETGRQRPFASSLLNEKRCPVVEFVDQLKEKAETLTSKLRAAGASDEEVKAQVKNLNQLISDLSPKTVYVYNAADKSGEVGLLELKSTAHKSMKACMAQYIQDYNQDPTSLGSTEDDSGVWFDVERSGLGRDTEYKVSKCQTRLKVGASLSFVDDRSPLPEAVSSNYDNLAYDLTSVYQIKTYDELTEILAANLDRLTEICPEADLSGTVRLEAAMKAAPAPTVSKVQGAAKPALKLDDSDDEEDAMPPVAAAPKASTRKAPAPMASDDDFMKQARAILES